MIQVTNRFKKLINRTFLPSIIILLVQFSALTTQGQQQVIECYPQVADYWTGTCNSTSKTEASLVKWKADGTLRGWFMFDVSSIPISVTIDSVKLIYFCNTAVGTMTTSITPMTLNPTLIGTLGSAIYTAIGSATPYVTTSSTAYGLENWIWRTITLGSPTLTTAPFDLKNSLVSGRFRVGVKTTTTGTPYRYASGQAQPGYIPILRVVFTPAINHDAGIDSITSPKNLYCAGVYPIQVKLRNAGTDAITTVKINWWINGSGPTQYSWAGNLAPGQTTYVTIHPGYTFTGGMFNIVATTSMPNGLVDGSTNNDSKTVLGQILFKPTIYLQPIDLNTTVGGAVVFNTIGSPIGVLYQWQVSIDGANTFTNLSNGGSYLNVTTQNLQVSNVTLAMNGYEYRCVVTGVCTPPAITDTVILGVGPPIVVKLTNGYACPANSITIPCNVTNMSSVNEIKLTMNYNPAVLSTPTYSNLNPLLLGGIVTLTESPAGHLTFHWTGTAATISNGKICDFNFSFASGNSTIIFDTLTNGASKFVGAGGIRFPTDYHNGNAYSNNPSFLTGPGDPPYAQTTDIGGSAMFYTVSSGAPVFTWQYSTPPLYSTWTDLTTNPLIYPNGIHNDTLWIANALQSMDNYKYKCKAVACGNTTTSNSALLQVRLKVKMGLDTIHACYGDYVTFSCKVRNMIDVASASLYFYYQNTSLTFIDFPSTYPGIVLNNVLNSMPGWNAIAVAWYVLTPLTLANESVFFTVKFLFVADSTILQWDTWNIGNLELSDTVPTVLNSQFQNGYALYAGPKVETQPINQTIAAGDTATFTVTGSGWTALTYTWQYSTPPLYLTWTPVTLGGLYAQINTATTSKLKVQGPTQVPYNGYKYRCVITGSCSPANSNAALLTVTPPPAKFIAPIINTCLGDPILVDIKTTDFKSICGYSLKIRFDSTLMTYTTFSNKIAALNVGTFSITNPTTGTIVMTWTNAGPVTIPGTAIMFRLEFASTTLFTNSPLTWVITPTPTTYCPSATLTPKYTLGSVSTNPLPPSHNITTPAPANGHFCAGSPGVQIGLDYMNTGVNYALYNNSIVIPGYEGVGGTGQPQAFGVFNMPGIYTVVATNQLGGCTRNMDGQVEVVSDPMPTAYTVTGGGAYCQGSPGVPVGLSNSQTGVIYILFRNNVRVDSLPGSGSPLSFGVQNISGSYTVKAKNNITNTCLADMNPTVIVSVNQVPTVNQPSDQVVCNSFNTTGITFSGIVTGTNYAWTATPNVGSGASGSGTTLSPFMAVNAGNTPISSTFVVTPTANSCTGTPKTFNIIVNPTPSITGAPGNQTLCNSTPATAITFTGPVSNTSYNWGYTPASPSIGITTPGTGNIPVFTAVNATANPIVANFTVTPIANTCPGTAKTFTITVNPTPVITNTPVNQTLCHNQLAAAVTFTIPVTGTNVGWTYTPSSPSIGITSPGSGNIAAFTALNTTTSPIVASFTVTPTANSCTGPIKSFTITVNPIPNAQLAAVTPSTICKDATPFTLIGTPAGGTYTGSTGITNASTGAFNPSLVTGSQTVTYSLTQNGCTASSSTTFTVVAKAKISGSVNYDVATGNPLGNILIERKDYFTNVLIDNVTSAVAVTPGSYEFRCVNPGTYRLVPSTTRPWEGGVNATDALLALRYSVALITLTNLRKHAADVNNSNYVSAIDALLITKRFTGAITSFAAGDWIFELNDSVPVSAIDITRQILSLKVGDVNADANPPVAKLKPGIRLQQSGEVTAESMKTFEIPLFPTQKLSLGAMSIVLEYPTDYIEIMDVKSTLDNFEYFVDRGEVRIGWFSLTPMTFNPDVAMFIIRGRVYKDTPQNAVLGFEPGIECELADGDGNVLNPPTLIYPALVIASSHATFVVPNEHEYYLGSNYPNPFTRITEIPYYLPESSTVKVKLLNLLGEEILTLYDGTQQQGTYYISFEGSGLSPGMYLYQLSATGKSSTYIKSRTLIINR